MIFSTFKEFKKNYKKKNFSQIYAIKNKPKLETIEKLIELVSLTKESFIFFLSDYCFLSSRNFCSIWSK